MRKSVARAFTAVLLAAATMFVVPAGPASASQPVNFDIACQLNYGQVGWRATLAYPNQGGFGWRCYLVGNASNLKGVNIEQYCQYYYGLHARGGSTAYNWRCDF